MLRYGTIRQGAAGIALLAVLTLALGFGYPLVVTGISQLFFHHQANGSLVYSNGKLTGSALLGQSFTSAKGNPLPQYFQPRPSAVDYNGAGSGASNLGPSNPVLLNQVSERARAYRAFNHLPAGAAVPVVVAGAPVPVVVVGAVPVVVVGTPEPLMMVVPALPPV